MSKAKGGNFLFDVIMPKVYGIGAAVVIVGALFKIQHWEGAGAMLTVGLLTEAIIFFLSAFQPQSHDVDWTRVYPQLADDYTGPKAALVPNAPSVTGDLDKMLRDANVTPATISTLGQGLNRLSETTAQMADLSDATVATKEYTSKVRTAAGSLEKINEAYATTVDAIKQMTSATSNTREYHEQVQNITKNLGALNAVYEMELQDANNHLKSMNRFYGNLTVSMQNLTDASKDTEQFKNEVSTLTKNLHSLNNVYGNMLNAMRS
ncbi:type IX secretion system motor protein PorL/GldL [Adhaeribacter radiodurans]|jgi:gliding motility-associated protein GldL|uniref:Gliding motility protein GldL n=1 Tax=Adhaeribacter radiodurans TaxID=2745197 RepID=A0A7L7L298_9BACT|nr:gliding motility protein GldL [Adhaeribacter radiodurans]QMU26890.1 gliding motility protein GldL [Adhaeribacter radiodurans]